MENRIIKVKAIKNFIVEAVFFNGDIVQYDMTRLFERYKPFKRFEVEKDLFEKVYVSPGGYGIIWDDELDLNAYTIWEDGVKVGNDPDVDLKYRLGYNLAFARKEAGMMQKDLAEKVGMYQADVSNIESGKANPSINTLQRLAEGLGMRLNIEFLPKE